MRTKYIIAFILSLIFCWVPTMAYAEEISNAPPEKPIVDTENIEKTNQSIDNYNEAVDKYNEQITNNYQNECAEIDKYNQEVDNQNQQIDKNYNDTIQEIDAKNNEINNHNIEEQQRVEQEQNINNQIQIQNEQNKAQAEQNKAENENRINEANQQTAQNKINAEAQVEADYQQALIDYNAAVEEDKNKIDALNEIERNRAEQAKQNNIEKQNQYDTDMIQYESDYKQYEKDKEFEDYVISHGYDSVESYNAAVATYNNKVDIYNSQVTAYHDAYGITNEIAVSSAQENSSTQEINISQTYTIQEGTEKTGRKIPVHLEHNFYGTDISYSEDFEIDAADIITFVGIAALVTAPVEGSCYFFYNTDTAHSTGMWVNSDSYLATNPTAKVSQDWINGDTHTVTYKNSTNEYQWNFEDICMIYNYWWVKLYLTKDYYEYANIPVKPTKPTLELEDENCNLLPYSEFEKPVKQQAVWETVIPELLDETYEEIPFITITPADIWNLLSYPEKAPYVNYKNYPAIPQLLEHMNYIHSKVVPQTTPEQENIDTQILIPALQNNAIVGTTNSNSISRTIANNNSDISLPAIGVIGPGIAYADTINDTENPGGSGVNPSWALVNLIAMIINILILIFVPRKEDKIEKIKYKYHNNIITVLLALAAVIIFIFTENVWLSMVLVDSWTILMIVICIAGIISKFFMYRTKEEME